jgi:hypothetical protein
MISTVLWFLYDYLSYKTDVIVPIQSRSVADPAPYVLGLPNPDPLDKVWIWLQILLSSSKQYSKNLDSYFLWLLSDI